MATNIEKKHFFQADKDGILHIAFVGTEEELQKQIDTEFDAELKKAQDELAKVNFELTKFNDLDLKDITIDNIGRLREFLLAKGKALQIENALKKAKKPSVADGTYFVIDKIGKDLVLEEHK